MISIGPRQGCDTPAATQPGIKGTMTVELIHEGPNIRNHNTRHRGRQNHRPLNRRGLGQHQSQNFSSRSTTIPPPKSRPKPIPNAHQVLGFNHGMRRQNTSADLTRYLRKIVTQKMPRTGKGKNPPPGKSGRRATRSEVAGQNQLHGRGTQRLLVEPGLRQSGVPRKWTPRTPLKLKGITLTGRHLSNF